MQRVTGYKLNGGEYQADIHVAFGKCPKCGTGNLKPIYADIEPHNDKAYIFLECENFDGLDPSCDGTARVTIMATYDQ